MEKEGKVSDVRKMDLPKTGERNSIEWYVLILVLSIFALNVLKYRYNK